LSRTYLAYHQLESEVIIISIIIIIIIIIISIIIIIIIIIIILFCIFTIVFIFIFIFLIVILIVIYYSGCVRYRKKSRALSRGPEGRMPASWQLQQPSGRT